MSDTPLFKLHFIVTLLLHIVLTLHGKRYRDNQEAGELWAAGVRAAGVCGGQYDARAGGARRAGDAESQTASGGSYA